MKPKLHFACLAPFFCALAATPALADLTWDSNGLTNNWSTASGNTNWLPGGVAWSQNENAFFGVASGAPETVTVTTANTFNNITFEVDGFVVANGAGSLTLANDQASTIAVVNASDTGSVLEALSNNGAGISSLTKSGAGILVLGGSSASTYSGQTLVTAGTLKTASATALGAGGVGAETIVSSGATLDVNGAALTNTEIVRIVGSGVGGLGALVNTGAGQQNALNRVELTGAATVGGSARFDVRPGTTPTLDLAGFTLTKVGTSSFHVVGGTVTNGEVIINGGTFAIETSTLFQGSGTVTINSGGNLGVYGNPVGNVTRDILSNNGSITNLGSSGTVNSNISIVGGSTLATTGGNTQTFAGNITGSGPLAFTGPGAIAPTGTNTYTGGTTITDARLQIGTSATAIPAGTVTVNGDGTVPDGQFFSGAVTLPASFNFNIAGRGGNTIDASQRGAMRLDGTTVQGFIVLSANAALGANGTNVGTVDGVISGAFELSKVDGGTIVLTADNTYSGGTRVSAGTLRLDYSTSDTSKLADSGVLMMAGGTLSLANSTATTHTEVVASTMIVGNSVSVISRVSGANRIALGAISLVGGGRLNLEADSLATTTNVPVGGNLGSSITVGGTSLATTNGLNEIVAVGYTDIPTVTGTILNGMNQVRLTGAAGNVALDVGPTVSIGSLTRSVGGLATIVTTGKTLRLGQNGTIFSATGSGGITIGNALNAGVLTAGGADNTAGSLDFNVAAGVVTVNSTITDNGSGVVSLTKTGANDLVLKGTNTYSGGTTLNAGFIRISDSDSALGTGNLTFAGNSSLATANGSTARSLANNMVVNSGITASFDSGYAGMTFTGVISGAGNIATASSGTTTLTGANTYAGTTTLGGNNTLAIGNGGTTGSLGAGAVTVGAGTTLAFNRSNNYNLSNSFAASTGTLRQNGSGILNIQAAAALLPTNLVVNGPAVLSGGGFSANRMNGNGVVTINSGGTLTLSGAHALGGDNGSMSETVTLNAGGTLTLNNEQYFKVFNFNGGSVGGAGQFRASSASDFQVAGSTASTVSNSFSHLGGPANWTVADVTASPAADITLSGVVSNSGALNKSGVGTLLLTHASNTYSGATTVNGGTLAGTGSTGSALSVTAAGTLAPGAGIGTYKSTTATFVSGAILLIDIDSSAATSDQLKATGAVDLGGSTLTLTDLNPGVITPGTKLTLVDYSGGSLTGSFAGLVEGASVVVGSNTYNLSYADGSKVTLTAASGGDDYSDWAASFTPNPGAAGVDYDQDGMSNGVEFILGGSPVNGSNNPRNAVFIADSSDVGSETELILTIAVPVGTPAFAAGAPATSIFAGFGIAVRGSTDLSGFPVTVTPVTPVVTGLPALTPQGGVSYEYRSFSLDGSNGTPAKGFLQVGVTHP